MASALTLRGDPGLPRFPAAGNLGKPGSPRRVKAEAQPISFRPLAAQPYDDRCLSWQHDARTVSIWTATGRLKGVAFTGSPDNWPCWPPTAGVSRI